LLNLHPKILRNVSFMNCLLFLMQCSMIGR